MNTLVKHSGDVRKRFGKLTILGLVLIVTIAAFIVLLSTPRFAL